ncbi:hypothetical protein [Phytohabitans rumicis]|nr:hypothetical protein [Phytohabitans rumicis]
MVAVVGLGFTVLIAVVAAAVGAVDRRRRYQAIDREWEHVAPQWNRHHR